MSIAMDEVALQPPKKKPRRHIGLLEMQDMKQKYFLHETTDQELAKKMDIPYPTFKRVVIKKKWNTERAQLEAELQSAWDADVKFLMIQHRPRVMQQHLEMSNRLAKQIIGATPDTDTGGRQLDAEDLEKLARASHYSSGVAARVVGMDHPDHGKITANMNLLVQVGVMPQAVVPVPMKQVHAITISDGRPEGYPSDQPWPPF